MTDGKTSSSDSPKEGLAPAPRARVPRFPGSPTPPVRRSQVAPTGSDVTLVARLSPPPPSSPFVVAARGGGGIGVGGGGGGRAEGIRPGGVGGGRIRQGPFSQSFTQRPAVRGEEGGSDGAVDDDGAGEPAGGLRRRPLEILSFSGSWPRQRSP